jgi:putative transposase
MKTLCFSDSQILPIVEQAGSGVPISELHREHDTSAASFYKWRAKYGGIDASLMRQMKN